MVPESGGSDADIGYCPETANSVKRCKAGKESDTGEPAIAVSQNIV